MYNQDEVMNLMTVNGIPVYVKGDSIRICNGNIYDGDEKITDGILGDDIII